MNDPLVVALTAALEGLLLRGLEVQPCGDGWTIKLAQEDRSADEPPEQEKRSW